MKSTTPIPLQIINRGAWCAKHGSRSPLAPKSSEKSANFRHPAWRASWLWVLRPLDPEWFPESDRYALVLPLPPSRFEPYNQSLIENLFRWMCGMQDFLQRVEKKPVHPLSLLEVQLLLVVAWVCVRWLEPGSPFHLVPIPHGAQGRWHPNSLQCRCSPGARIVPVRRPGWCLFLQPRKGHRVIELWYFIGWLTVG